MRSILIFVNTLKVRGSWGELGNQNTDNWYPFYRIIDYKQNNGGCWSMAET